MYIVSGRHASMSVGDKTITMTMIESVTATMTSNLGLQYPIQHDEQPFVHLLLRVGHHP